MKLIKVIFLGLLVSLSTISCKEASKQGRDAVVKTAQSENLRKIEVGIEGMTCQIGCAKIIESKLVKTPGVSAVAVSFDNKLGEIVYDTNKISEEEISKKITSIAGGETYTVTSIKEIAVDSPSEIKSCAKKCDESCTKADCAKCAAVKADCKTKCANKDMACCSADLKTCTMKCSTSCSKSDCAKCATAQADCKTKCAVKKQACCTGKKMAHQKKCNDSCTKKDCEKCATAAKECAKKCASKA